MKICDHTSVGMLVWRGDKLLLIERNRPPYGFAVPAGHVDSDHSFEEAAKRELKEEVGLDTAELTLLAEGRRENSCRRTDGTWHYWKLYRISVVGEVTHSVEEVKQANWYTQEEMKKLATRTERYRNKEIGDEEWNKDPGLEPVMYDWLKELKII